MVMDQFVTTQRADYVWPYVATIGAKPHIEDIAELLNPASKEICPCHCTTVPYVTEDRKVLGPAAVEDQSWSRLGPMGPLLDPKLYPARVGAAPEFKTSRFNQPNVFLRKLQEKYPFLYEVLKTAPPNDMLSRINKDRLRTTYQVDFCHLGEYPNAPYDELLRQADLLGTAPCKEPQKLPGDPCRALVKDTSYRRGGPGNTKDYPSGRGIDGQFAGGKPAGGGISGGLSGGKGGSGGGKGSSAGGGKGPSGGGGKGAAMPAVEEKCALGIGSWSPKQNQSIYSQMVKDHAKMIKRDIRLHAHGNRIAGRRRLR